MLELLRIYQGYCVSCRMPATVGEFQVQGWKHRFTMCSACLGTVKSKLDNELANAIGAVGHADIVESKNSLDNLPPPDLAS